MLPEAEGGDTCGGLPCVKVVGKKPAPGLPPGVLAGAPHTQPQAVCSLPARPHLCRIHSFHRRRSRPPVQCTSCRWQQWWSSTGWRDRCTGCHRALRRGEGQRQAEHLNAWCSVPNEAAARRGAAGRAGRGTGSSATGGHRTSCRFSSLAGHTMRATLHTRQVRSPFGQHFGTPASM